MRPLALLTLLAALQAPAQSFSESHFQGYTQYVQALLGFEFTPAEQATIRRHVQGYFAQGRRENIQTVLGAGEQLAKLAQQPPDLVRTAMTMTRPDALLGLHKAAAAGAPDSQYLLDLYYQRNPKLAEGHPNGLPLTRDMVEADLAIKHWLAREIHRQPAPAPDSTVLQQALSAAVADHARLSPADQLTRARQSGEWARIRYGWARASEIDKLLTRQDMGARLTPQESAMVQQVMAGFNAQLNGMVQQHQQSMFNGAIQNMKQNSETIMGRGTVWNPATNRWEQQGGIVTEYNGTVRVP